jgi:hypothetical protein
MLRELDILIYPTQLDKLEIVSEILPNMRRMPIFTALVICSKMLESSAAKLARVNLPFLI